MSPETPIPPQPDPSFESTYSALIGAGMSEWSSLVALYTDWPSETVDLGHRLLVDLGHRLQDEEEVADILGAALAEVGSQCPTAAQEMFSRLIAHYQFKDLVLPNASWLSWLPPSLVVPDYFYLAGYSAPTFPSNGMSVGGTFFMEECPNIQQLPNDLILNGFIWISDCNNLIALPEALTVNGCLEITRCNALVELPTGLSVDGILAIQDCCNFKSLPIELHVSDMLSIRSCSSWDGQIPSSARIGGIIYTDAYPDGLSLIEWRLVHQP